MGQFSVKIHGATGSVLSANQHTTHKADIETLHAVIKLVQEVIAELGVSPSPEKVADVVVATFQEEMETGSQDFANLAKRHHGKLTLMLKP